MSHEKIGRLVFTRFDNQSFHLGDDTIVAVKQLPGQRAKIDITRSNRAVEVYTVGFGEPFFPLQDVHVEISKDQRHTKSMKVMVLAPKSIRIMRSELLSEEAPRKAAAV